ncbi:MAG: type II toxin-antitoxin system RelE/ParE family toxin [Pleurocapsa sp. SU_196_0]|nr:type II toxin-antitoxin system RelE/ParE family toxin [Pleurocapsa sp. SU_196_0]
MKLNWTTTALEDLADIWEFLEEQDSAFTADAIVNRLQRVAQELLELPEIGRRREDLMPGVRSLKSGSYLLFYVIGRGTIEVIHVLHEHRDLSAIFNPNP